MAEGSARLNRQVVQTEYWERSDCVGRLDAPSTPKPDLVTLPTSDERERRRLDVRRLVDADIVPRVFLDRDLGVAIPGTIGQGAGVGGADEVVRFARLLLDYAGEVLVIAHVDAAVHRGIPVAAIYLDLFQPAARYIGELWADDRCTFVDVTLAIGTLQKMLRRLEPEFHRNGRPPERDRQALLVPLPGDQHTFGLSMVSEFFRRAGWNVWNTPSASIDALGRTVATAWFTLVGLSASTDSHLDDLTTAIRLIRRKSLNRHVGVLVGGPIFVTNPDNVGRVGADGMGGNAVDALAEAEAFVARSAPP